MEEEQTIVTTTLVTLLTSMIDNDESEHIVHTNNKLIINDIKSDNIKFVYDKIHLLFRHENVKNMSPMVDTITFSMRSIVELQSKGYSKEAEKEDPVKQNPDINNNPIFTIERYFNIIKSEINNVQFIGGSYKSQVETLKKSIMNKIIILNNK